jgi:hypothetical protein
MGGELNLSRKEFRTVNMNIDYRRYVLILRRKEIIHSGQVRLEFDMAFWILGIVLHMGIGEDLTLLNDLA